MSRFSATATIGCKSVYDHVTSVSSCSTAGDRRVAVDMVIIRESLDRTSTKLRWAPTHMQLADVLTKDAGEPADLARSVLRHNQYQLADEQLILDRAKQERERRKQRISKAQAQPPAEPQEVCTVATSPLRRCCHCGCSEF